MCCTLSTFVDYTIANTPLLTKNAPHLLHSADTTICLHFPTLCLHNSVSTLFPHFIYTIASQKCATFVPLCLHFFAPLFVYTLLHLVYTTVCPHFVYTFGNQKCATYATLCRYNYLSTLSYTLLTQLLCPHSSHTSTTPLLIKNAPHLLHFYYTHLSTTVCPHFATSCLTIVNQKCATFATLCQHN